MVHEVEALIGRYCDPSSPIRPAHPNEVRPDRYVLFVLAPWSGPSIAALRTLGGLASEGNDAWPARVVHIDDAHTEPLLVAFRLHGQGETFWVEHGTIVRADLGGGAQRRSLR